MQKKNYLKRISITQITFYTYEPTFQNTRKKKLCIKIPVINLLIIVSICYASSCVIIKYNNKR